MGEKVEGKKRTNEAGVKKTADDEETSTVVLKLDLHCEGCAKKVQRAVSQFEGVEKVKAEYSVNKLTIIGNVAPTLLRDRVEQKTKKKVDLIAPPPSKKPQENRIDEAKIKEVATSTVMMKIRLHCDECAHKIQRTIVKNIVGVKSVTTDLQKDLVTVTGTMTATELTTYLGEKLKRNVGIVDNGGDKKEGDKKEGDRSKSSGGETTVEVVNKMEYHSFNPQTHYAVPPPPMMHYTGMQVYGNYGGPPPPPPEYVKIDEQLLSDENANGCSMM